MRIGVTRDIIWCDICDYKQDLIGEEACHIVQIHANITGHTLTRTVTTRYEYQPKSPNPNQWRNRKKS